MHVHIKVLDDGDGDDEAMQALFAPASFDSRRALRPPLAVARRSDGQFLQLDVQLHRYKLLFPDIMFSASHRFLSTMLIWHKCATRSFLFFYYYARGPPSLCSLREHPEVEASPPYLVCCSACDRDHTHRVVAYYVAKQ